ncbi:MAG: hypothetical protein ACI8RD_012513 [Bacillariaceae sp.]|jgi:hypothetical protein
MRILLSRTMKSICVICAGVVVSLLLVIPNHDYHYAVDGFLLSDIGLNMSPTTTTTTTTTTIIRRQQRRQRIRINKYDDGLSLLTRDGGGGGVISTISTPGSACSSRITTLLFLQPTSSSSSSGDQPTKTKTVLPATTAATLTRTSSSPPSTIKTSTLSTTDGPDLTTKPDYENIHGPLGKFVDDIFLTVFRTKLAYYVGVDSDRPKNDYKGLIELSNALNSRYSDRKQVQQIAQQTLLSLFPSWLPSQFAILFAKPFPKFSSRMNAWATRVGGTWLMGECEVNDIEIDGIIHKDQGLLVKRCRFLEESGCASICVNSCKIPTQNFFLEDMGLPLTMTPDYNTYECQFSFGQLPNEQDEFDAKNTPCLSRCPTAGSMRKWHTSTTTTNGSSSSIKSSLNATSNNNSTTTNTIIAEENDSNNICGFMEND